MRAKGRRSSNLRMIRSGIGNSRKGTIHEISGGNEQEKFEVGLTSLSACDTPPSAARRGASNEHVFVGIREMTLFDPFTGGFNHYKGGIFRSGSICYY